MYVLKSMTEKQKYDLKLNYDLRDSDSPKIQKIKGQPNACEINPPTQRMMKDPNAAPKEKTEKNQLWKQQRLEHGRCPHSEVADLELLGEDSLLFILPTSHETTSIVISNSLLQRLRNSSVTNSNYSV